MCVCPVCCMWRLLHNDSAMRLCSVIKLGRDYVHVDRYTAAAAYYVYYTGVDQLRGRYN
jgi:hypothetical protein